MPSARAASRKPLASTTARKARAPRGSARFGVRIYGQYVRCTSYCPARFGVPNIHAPQGEIMNSLFKHTRIGATSLANRVVMAPMTRSRAIDNIPNDLLREYYAQRASAGLIITEGTAPSPDALGYARIPGIYSEQQVQGWSAVTHAVHAGGGAI